MTTYRKITYFIDNIKEIDFCGQTFYQLNGGSYILPYKTHSTNGEHSLTNCEGCRKTKNKLINEIKLRLEKFPNCCEHHRKLLLLKQFRKEDFNNAPEEISDKILFSYHHIINNLDSENWEKEITDYIEYTVGSFGSFPSKYGEPFLLGTYFSCLVELLGGIESSIESNIVSKEEIIKRYKFVLKDIARYGEVKKKNKNTDLNVLLQTYQKWIKVFPFDINSYFGGLREKFINELPILSGEPEINKYSGVASIKMHSKESLIKYLLKLTDSLLRQINASVLYENGLITDINKISIELIINERKLELKKGYVSTSTSEEQRYRKIIKSWFADEEKFLKKLTPLLTNQRNIASNENSINDYPLIFKNGKAYSLFLKLHDKYYHNSKKLANYSFIYYALNNDGLLVCSGIDYRNFLAEKFDVTIDKIDSRQCGEEKKLQLYVAIKESL